MAGEMLVLRCVEIASLLRYLAMTKNTSPPPYSSPSRGRKEDIKLYNFLEGKNLTPSSQNEKKETKMDSHFHGNDIERNKGLPRRFAHRNDYVSVKVENKIGLID